MLFSWVELLTQDGQRCYHHQASAHVFSSGGQCSIEAASEVILTTANPRPRMQETKATVFDRPVDMAWIRVPAAEGDPLVAGLPPQNAPMHGASGSAEGSGAGAAPDDLR